MFVKIETTRRWIEWCLWCSLAIPPTAMSAGGIRTDGTVGANSQWLGKPQPLSGTHVTISQEMGSTAGKNLFHSFSEFNVRKEQTVTFTGADSLKNVISRVTGSGSSDIDGTLRSTAGKADVYLINPNGVTFGAGAQVDVPAAFYVSTADELKLKDGARFSAKDPDASTLSTAPPAAFGYLDTSPANNGLIKVDGAQLQMKPGQTLDIAAGQIQVENGATLAAEAGEVRLVASRGKATVSMERDFDGHLPLPADRPSQENAGPVSINGDAAIDVQGDGSGKIGLWGGPTTIENGFVLSSNTGPKNSTKGKGIDTKTRSLRIDNSVVASDTFDKGTAGHVHVETSEGLEVINGGVISTSTLGGNEDLEETGNAGEIRIVSGGDILVDRLRSEFDTAISANAAPNSTGNAGSVHLTSQGDLTIQNGALITSDTYGKGSAGKVALIIGGNLTVDRLTNARTTGILSQAEPGSEGEAGSVVISTGGDVRIRNGGEIASGTYGKGQGGTVSVTTSGNLVIDGQNSDFFTGLAANANSESSREAGNVFVFLNGNVDIRGGGEISSSTFVEAQGDAGVVAVTAEGAITIDGADTHYFTGIGTQANPNSAGNGGKIAVQAGTNLAVLNGGKISSATFATGKSGEVNVTAGRDVAIMGRNEVGASGIISLTDDKGDGGNVFVRAANNLSVLSSGVISSNSFGEGNAGNVWVAAGHDLTIDGDGTSLATGITSQANELGTASNAGNVSVSAGDKFVVSKGGIVDSSTWSLGHAGNVAVYGGKVVVDGGGVGATSKGVQSGGKTGSVDVAASESLSITNGGTISIANEGIAVNPAEVVAGRLSVTAPVMALDRGEISAKTSGNVAGGRIDATATGTLSLKAKSAITASTTGAGGAGSTKVQAARMTIDDSEISAASTGLDSSGQTGNVGVSATKQLKVRNGGKISIANEALVADPGTVTPGNLSVTAPQVVVNGGSITADTSGDVAAGSIKIDADRALTLKRSGAITSSTSQAGSAGSLSIDTAIFRMDHSAVAARAGSKSSGRTGDIRISARESLRLGPNAQISIANEATIPEANLVRTGQIRMDSPDMKLTNARITTTSTGNLDAGDISLLFGSGLRLDDSSITTSADAGNGGAIAAQGAGTIQLENSQIQSSVSGANGNGGDIAVRAGSLVINTGLIEANAESGNGGDVTLDVGALIPSGNVLNGRNVAAGDYLQDAANAGEWQSGTFGSNIVRAESESGLSGVISLTAPQLNLSGVLANLGSPAFDAARVSLNACLPEPGSSLTLGGHGGLPPRPRDWTLY